MKLALLKPEPSARQLYILYKAKRKLAYPGRW